MTVSVRNTGAEHTIRVEAVRYFGYQGQQQGEHFAESRALGPEATAEVAIQQWRLSGDTGANLILEWRSDAPVTLPMAETVMVGIKGTQSLAFPSRAVVLWNDVIKVRRPYPHPVFQRRPSRDSGALSRLRKARAAREAHHDASAKPVTELPDR